MNDAASHTTPVKPKPTVELFTDGDCIGNPGPGGWAFILRHPSSGRTKEKSGGEQFTTNNRMEVLAVIMGLEALKLPSAVDLCSDSEYVVKGIMERMATNAACHWHKSINSKQLIKNDDLWRRLYELSKTHEITVRWVRGHDGHPENERCDQMAAAAAKKMSMYDPNLPKTLEQMADDLLAEAEERDD